MTKNFVSERCLCPYTYFKLPAVCQAHNCYYYYSKDYKRDQNFGYPSLDHLNSYFLKTKDQTGQHSSVVVHPSAYPIYLKTLGPVSFIFLSFKPSFPLFLVDLLCLALMG